MALTKVKSGNILLTTPSASSNDVTPATTQYVTTAIGNLIDTAPSTLNTLNELAAALGDDVNFSTTVTNSIATKLPLAGGTMTGGLIVQAATGQLRLQGTSNTNKNVSIFYNESADYGQINVDESGVNQKDLWITGLNLKFGRSTSSESMRIDSSGTVKISHADTASEGLRVIQTTAARTSGGALGLFYDDQAGTTQPTLKVIQNGTGDILQLFDGANQVVTVKDGGNVGIGTDTPDAKLELNVPTGDGLLITSADIATIKMKNVGGAVKNWGFATTNLAASDFGIYASNSVGGDPITAGTAKLYFRSNGKVGIGTTSPSHGLTVSDIDGGDDADMRRITIKSQTHGVNSGFRFDSESANGTARGSGYYFQPGDTDATTYLGLTATDAAYQMVITREGNVGIGTATPAVPLHVRKVAGLNTTVELLRLDCGDTTHVGGKAGTIKFTDISIYNPTAEITASRVGVTSASFLKFDLRSSEIMRMESGGDMIYGGATGVHEKYFSGFTTGNGNLSHDITHTADNATGTVLEIKAAFTHHPSYDCILHTWISRRDAAVSHHELFRRDTTLSGSWTVSRVSSTVTRVTKNAGTYAGGGPYWIKALWRNY